jgi:8-oxo-dGTP pyrophosphatase MutT (NUDIX family)
VGGPDPILIAAANAFIRIDDKVLLQQRGDSGTWNMPGGAIELGERIDQTAVREAREETGLEVEPIRLVGVYSDPHWHVHYPHGDAVQVFAVHFECRVIGGALKTDGVETIDVRWFPLDDLPVNLPERHRVRIADALAGWEGAFVR